jgi:hypothetical protein
MFKVMLEKLKRIDKGFYFAIFLAFTVPLVLLICDWRFVIFYVFVVSLAHRVLLVFFPYIKDSEYYRYLAKKQSFFEGASKYRLPYRKKTFLISKWVLVGSSCWMISNPTLFQIVFPIQIGSLVIFLQCSLVDIVNIYQRPRMPEALRFSHPILQRRYGPFVDIVVNKILPMCARGGGVILSGYASGVFGYKIFNGANEVDPLRSLALTRYHGFPSSFEWTEVTLSAWSSFKKWPSVKDKPYGDQVKLFVENQKKIEDAFEKVSDICFNEIL